MTADRVLSELNAVADANHAEVSKWFFKTNKGQYGEGDQFIGVKVPKIRIIAKKYVKLPLDEVKKLAHSPIHEARLAAVLIMTYQMTKADEAGQSAIADGFVELAKDGYVNNWDIVDSSCHKILGPIIFQSADYKTLDEMSNSGDLWQERISVMTTYYFIKRDLYDQTFIYAEKFLNHKHDLMHKVVGWMLREIGKRDLAAEEQFLKVHYKRMPRTMLRYAIEHFDETKRQRYLKGEV